MTEPIPASRVRNSGRRRFQAALVILVTSVLGGASVAGAHTDFVGSTPIDGSVLDVPVDTITVSFTAASEVAGDGFAVLTPAGEVLRPPVSQSDDGTTFTLVFEPPLTDGEYAVRWSVRAGDAHPIDGVFTFATTALPPPPETTTTTQPETSSSAQPDPTSAPESTATTEAAAPPSDQEDALAVEVERSTIEDFFESSSAVAAGGGAARAGRLVSIPAALLLVGVVAFVALVDRGRRKAWIRSLIGVGAIALFVGSLIELVGLAQSFGGLGDTLSSSAGVAVLLRVAAAAVALLGVGAGFVPATALAAVLAVASFQFDGHTVTEGTRWMVAVADAAHVGAGAVWLGGIVCLVVARRFEDGHTWATLVARFSVVAAVAVAVVGLAGVFLAVSILDSFSQLWQTSWGQILVAKSCLVAVTMGIGAFNHYRLVPEVSRESGSITATRRLAVTIQVEAVLLVLASLTTAVLVAASTAG